MYKKAQAQIITIVLIILLVLAAILIVNQVITSTIKEGGEQISAQSSCIGVSMEVTNTVAASCDDGVSTTESACTGGGGTWDRGSITVRRGQGSTDTSVDGYKLFINGAKETDQTTSLDPLDTDTYNPSTTDVNAGDKVSVAAVLGETVCAASAEVTVA